MLCAVPLIPGYPSSRPLLRRRQGASLCLSGNVLWQKRQGWRNQTRGLYWSPRIHFQGRDRVLQRLRQDSKSRVMSLHREGPGRSLCAERDDGHKRAGALLPSVTTSCGIILGGCGRVGVTQQCWDRTSPAEAPGPVAVGAGGVSASETAVSASLPVPLPQSAPAGGSSSSSLGSSLLPTLSPRAPPSPPLIPSLQRCRDPSPFCAGGLCPSSPCRGGQTCAGGRLWGARGLFRGPCAGRSAPDHAGPGLLVIFSNRCY